MKLDPVFTVKENKLYKIENNEAVDLSSLKRIEIKWSIVEMEDEAYNEEFLAQLRDQLKTMEAAGQFAILVPVVDKPLQTPDSLELFNNAFNHTARRVKDCVSVAGFELPSELTDAGFGPDSPSQAFMELLAIKHAQYVYFTMLKNAPSNVVIFA